VPGPVLSVRDLNRTLLARQLLLARVERSMLEVIEHLIGLQAQVPMSPYVALWSRVHAFDPDELGRMLVDRQVVRMVLMRGTIHLVSVDDALALRPVVQPVLDGELSRNRTYSSGLEGIDLDPVLAFGRALVVEQPRTLAELRTAMAERWPDRDAASLAYAIRNLLPTIQVPPRGVWGKPGPPRLTTIQAWTGRSPGSETAPDATILRYLAAFGPATVADIAAWSRLSGLREAVERLRPQLTVVHDDQGRELFDVHDWLFVEGDVAAPVRFLPDYDNVLLAHADRSRILPEAMQAVGASGIIGRPSFLVDGFLAGFWKLQRPTRGANDRVATLSVEPLMRLERGQRREVEAEATDLLSLLVPSGSSRVVIADPR
jgi:DNA glycosylase AlkZ-like